MIGAGVGRIVLVFALTLAAAQPFARTSTGSSSSELFEQANALYRVQNFSGAHGLYLQIAQAGIRSPEVFYNLGNTAARLGRTGEAVLFYERARELSPRDTDLLANLQRIAPPGNDPAPSAIARPFAWVLHRFSVREWVSTFLILSILASFVGALYLSRRFPGGVSAGFKWTAVALGFLALLTAPFALVRLSHSHEVQVIVMEPDIVIRSGPGDNYSPVTTLPEGSKLRRVPFSDPAWAQVELPAGQRGFTPARSLQAI